MDGLRRFAKAVGTFQARVLLSLFYLLVLLPFALIAKAKHPLGSQGWQRRQNSEPVELAKARRQF